MPERDDVDRGGDGGASRRAVLAGGLACGLVAAAGVARAADALRLGVVEALGVDASAVDELSLALWGRPAILVPFRSWGALRDHASALAGGQLDGAVLPARDGSARALPLAPVPAVLLRGHAAGRPIGVALRDPRSDAVVRRLLAGPSEITLVELPPAALADNVAAGLLDGAVLVGAAAAAAISQRRPGVQTLDAAAAASLIPPLCLVRCAGRRGAAAGA